MLRVNMMQEFFYLSEVGARGLLNMQKNKYLDHQDWENVMQF